MRRWPLSTAAILLVLAAHLTVALAGEPRRESRPVEARGRVVYGPPDVARAGYDLVITEGDRRYPLMPMSDAHRDVLRRAVATAAGEVEVIGILSSFGDQAYIVIQYIEELP